MRNENMETLLYCYVINNGFKIFEDVFEIQQQN